MPLDDNQYNRLQKEKCDLISSELLHQSRLSKLRLHLNINTFLGIALPILILYASTFITDPGTKKTFDIISGAIAAVMLIVSILLLVWQVPDNAEKHYHALAESSRLATEAENLQINRKIKSAEAANYFSLLVEKAETDSKVLLGNISEKERQKTYRQLLMRLDLRCETCEADPYKFKPGSCSVCGNTPNTEGAQNGPDSRSASHNDSQHTSNTGKIGSG